MRSVPVSTCPRITEHKDVGTDSGRRPGAARPFHDHKAGLQCPARRWGLFPQWRYITRKHVNFVLLRHYDQRHIVSTAAIDPAIFIETRQSHKASVDDSPLIRHHSNMRFAVCVESSLLVRSQICRFANRRELRCDACRFELRPVTRRLRHTFPLVGHDLNPVLESVSMRNEWMVAVILR
jgi:hypothetical protein